MVKRKRVLLPVLVAMIVLAIAGCRQKPQNSSEETFITTEAKEEMETASAVTGESIYQSVLADMKEDEYYAFLEVPESEIPILLISDFVFKDENGMEQSIECEAYYAWDGKVKELGTIASTGTAYPIRYDFTGIYAAGGHGVIKYAWDNKAKELVEVESAAEIFDKKGNATYEYFNQEDGRHVSKKSNEFDAMFKKYQQGKIVNFQKK